MNQVLFNSQASDLYITPYLKSQFNTGKELFRESELSTHFPVTTKEGSFSRSTESIISRDLPCPNNPPESEYSLTHLVYIYSFHCSHLPQRLPQDDAPGFGVQKHYHTKVKSSGATVTHPWIQILLDHKPHQGGTISFLCTAISSVFYTMCGTGPVPNEALWKETKERKEPQVCPLLVM